MESRPEGTAEVGDAEPASRFSRPFGTCVMANADPAVNCRAILKSPSGGWEATPSSSARGGAKRSRRRADLSNLALHAVGPARVATPPAVPDEPMAQERPLPARDELHQVFLDLLWLLLLRQPKPLREAGDVGVHDDPDIDAEGIPEHDVRGFPADAVEGDEFFHRVGHRAAVALDELAAASLDVLRLVAEKAR